MKELIVNQYSNERFNPLAPQLHFCAPRKHQKTAQFSGFLTLSGGMQSVIFGRNGLTLFRT